MAAAEPALSPDAFTTGAGPVSREYERFSGVDRRRHSPFQRRQRYYDDPRRGLAIYSPRALSGTGLRHGDAVGGLSGKPAEYSRKGTLRIPISGIGGITALLHFF